MKKLKNGEGDVVRPIFFMEAFFSLLISLLDKINNTIDSPPASAAINTSTV
jgi:hypothetical protein